MGSSDEIRMSAMASASDSLVLKARISVLTLKLRKTDDDALI